MCPGLSDDPQQIDDARKTAVISRELKRLNIDIAALQETRLPSNGSLKEEDYTFFWQGKAQEEHRVHGVGFAVRNSLLASVEPPSEGTARILSLRLSQLETAIKEVPPQNTCICLAISTPGLVQTTSPGPDVSAISA